MLDGLESIKHTIYTVIRDYINNAPIVNFGVVLEVYSQKSVRVAVMSSITEASVIVEASVLYPSTAGLEINHSIKEGDKGILLSLQNYSSEMFTSEEPLKQAGRKGYSNLNCVFIPYNTIKESAVTQVTIDEEKVLLKTKVPVTIETEDNFLLGAKEAKIVAEDNFIVEATETNLCGNAKTMVTFSALDSALASFKDSVDASIAGAIVGHTHVASSLGAPTATGIGSAPATSLDISSSEAKKVKTG